MFEKGDLVIYGTKGVCRIEDIRVPDIEGIDRLYYFLQPVFDSRDLVFSPVDSEKVFMRKVMEQDEAERFIQEIKDAKENEQFQEKINSYEYNDVMKSGDCMRWAHLITNLYRNKKGCAIRGKKMKYADTKVLREAEKLLYGELAAATNQTYEDTLKNYRAILY